MIEIFRVAEHAAHAGHVRGVPRFKPVEIFALRPEEQLRHVRYQRGVDVSEANVFLKKLLQFLLTAWLILFAHAASLLSFRGLQAAAPPVVETYLDIIYLPAVRRPFHQKSVFALGSARLVRVEPELVFRYLLRVCDTDSRIRS